MLCNRCHKKADGHNVNDTKFQQRYINMTLRIAKEEYYEFIHEDNEFIGYCISKGMVLLL
jgi:hypothetical protein